MEVPTTHYAVTAQGESVAYQVVGNGPFDLVFVRASSRTSSCSGPSRPSPASTSGWRRTRGSSSSTSVARGSPTRSRAPAAGGAHAGRPGGAGRGRLGACGARGAVGGKRDGCPVRGDVPGANERPRALRPDPRRLGGGASRRAAVVRGLPAFPDGARELGGRLGALPLGAELWRDRPPARPSRTGRREPTHGAGPDRDVARDRPPRVLPSISVPTLVLNRAEEIFPSEAARELAARIPGARHVELPGVDHVPWAGDSESYFAEIEEFLTGSASQRPATGCWPRSSSPTWSAQPSGQRPSATGRGAS